MVSDINIRYQVFLATLDGEIPGYDEGVCEPSIPIDRMDDQLTPEGARITAQEWFDANGWTDVTMTDSNRGHGYATAPDGTRYLTQLHEMRCGNYKLKYLEK